VNRLEGFSMKKMLLISLFSISAFAAEWTGTISDAHCGAKHAAGSAADQKCVETCVKGGAAPVFVSEGKVLKIADGAKVQEFLGKKVVVKGDLNGDTVTIASIEAAK
jgi:hypothetical protein